MTRTISKPGPPPKSCLTCRRRRKKCDLSKPNCKRCLKGEYECLGYGDATEHRAKSHQAGPSAPIASPARSISATDPVEMIRSKVLAPDSIPEGRQDPTNSDTVYDARLSILSAALVYRLSGPTSSTFSNDDDNIPSDSSEVLDRLWPQDQRQLVVYPRSSLHRSPGFGQFRGTFSSMTPSSDDFNKFINTLCHCIPPSVDAMQMMREDYFGRVVYEYHSQRVGCWFMVPPPAVRDSLLALLKWSKRMTWTMYLGARLFQALSGSLQAPGSMLVQGYIGWIEKLEQKFTTGTHNLPLSDVTDRFAVQLELAFLNFTLVNSALGYNLLQKALPKFLQIVAADSNLYLELPNGNLVVSFPRILSAPRYELRRFVVYDTIATLVLGVPPLVQYSYNGECDSRSHGLEWIHGVPVALIEVISQVNSWRAGLRIPRNGWEALERRVLSWQPSFLLTEDSATENVSAARVAVQEGWRNVVLIYIYMGICGVSSHDLRVQASVHRIVQLGETVANSRISVHLFTHCVIAGLAARLEKHRVFVHQMLLSFKNTRVWLFQGPQFSQVLYHLWHGVGVGGEPVKWDDYVRARCTIICS
ncbi:hypothetical protein ACGC1H_005835 [Rhizoctonia solani]|uniref:Zn(2)-C6 fungal-type domain-containing protein n=1 Tax=Rhizoctonia solani TaxID=456999 RepID=A0A8H3H2X8_9AGAM|nr:unnamed protein product [Rhizoctonia solani]